MSSLPTIEAISELAEIFPSWDEDALRDVLSSTNNNIAMATELIIEWTEEETNRGGRNCRDGRSVHVCSAGYGEDAPQTK